MSLHVVPVPRTGELLRAKRSNLKALNRIFLLLLFFFVSLSSTSPLCGGEQKLPLAPAGRGEGEGALLGSTCILPVYLAQLDDREILLVTGYIRQTARLIKKNFYRDVKEEELILGSLKAMEEDYPPLKDIPSRKRLSLNPNWNDFQNLFFEAERKKSGIYKRLGESAIKGMVECLGDPYSVYLNREDRAAFEKQMKGGNIAGIGVEIAAKDNSVVIIASFEGSPASKVGINGGEKILEVNGVPVKGKSLHKVADMMAGPAGSFIDLKLEKNEKVFSLKIKRENIRLRPLVCKVYRDGIGYIKCPFFGDNTEFQFSKALDKLRARNVKSLIIDLRNNPGGDFESSLKVASFFVQRKPLIYYKTRAGEPKPVISVRAVKFSGPVAVIVNGGTASAAEILTAALSENKRAVVVGTRTFGKAKVQTIFSLTGGSAIKLTTAEYLTPSGKNINEAGIIPEIIVENIPSGDVPLSKALQYLKNYN